MPLPDKLTASYFRRYGFAPATVIDVGVMAGTPFLYEAFPDAKFVLIDPLEESREAVARNWGGRIAYDFHLCAVGAATGQMELHVPAAGKARTSFGQRKTASDLRTSTRVVDIRPLDEISAAYAGSIGLKIDTEGHELAVLAGAVETLRRAEFVIAETSIKRRFTGGYRFSELVAFMAGHGFEVYAFLSGLTRSPRMADLLFVPWDSTRFDMGSGKG